LFSNCDKNGDGILEKEEFVGFYSNCSRNEKRLTVRENLKAFNIRPDLKKWREVFEENDTPKTELPRYFISTQ